MIGSKCGDRELLDALAAVVDGLDPAPESLAARAWSALDERTDAARMPLLSDSVFVDPPGGTRRLTFRGLDLWLSRVVGGLRAHGAARPGTVVDVRWPGGSATAAVGPAGWFHVEPVPLGPVRCVLRGACRDRATPWFVA